MLRDTFLATMRKASTVTRIDEACLPVLHMTISRVAPADRRSIALQWTHGFHEMITTIADQSSLESRAVNVSARVAARLQYPEPERAVYRCDCLIRLQTAIRPTIKSAARASSYGFGRWDRGKTVFRSRRARQLFFSLHSTAAMHLR